MFLGSQGHDFLQLIGINKFELINSHSENDHLNTILLHLLKNSRVTVFTFVHFLENNIAKFLTLLPFKSKYLYM